MIEPYPGMWFRIDKGNGTVRLVDSAWIADVARNNFKRPNQAIASLRFQTPFAIYSDGAMLTDEERTALSIRR